MGHKALMGRVNGVQYEAEELDALANRARSGDSTGCQRMSPDRYYLTTAIDYVNSKPHIGTAFEKIAADCIARYKRLRGFDTFFSMGNDEHSLNVEKEAKRQGLDPHDYCDRMAGEFEEIWSALNLSYDRFVRTTEPEHEKAVVEIFRRIDEKGDIYTDVYRGLYCVSCETFYQAKDLVDGKCPHHKTEPEEIEEENYFFRLKNYRTPLLDHMPDGILLQQFLVGL